jgi:hypothetical protein
MSLGNNAPLLRMCGAAIERGASTLFTPARTQRSTNFSNTLI